MLTGPCFGVVNGEVTRIISQWMFIGWFVWTIVKENGSRVLCNRCVAQIISNYPPLPQNSPILRPSAQPNTPFPFLQLPFNFKLTLFSSRDMASTSPSSRPSTGIEAANRVPATGTHHSGQLRPFERSSQNKCPQA
jgi:hypothetical protein